VGLPPRPPIPQAPVTTGARFVTPTFESARMFLLAWGDSGCGKTTLASTAPGEKALIQFDPQGHLSLSNRSDIHVLDLSGNSAATTMAEFNAADPFRMKAFITSKPAIETVIIDSVTTLAFQALQYAVTKAGGTSNIDVPGQNGYGVRNNVMRRVVQSIMQIVGGLHKNLIMITHEGAPDEASKNITMSLSASLANDVSLRFNEVWWMKDIGTERQIHVRAHGRHKPMKSRMFLTTGATNFVWNYDADTMTGDGIAEWLDAWRANGGKKIPLPGKGGTEE
jgi:AAA domain